MNPDTRVVVCCYQGDAHQVIDMLPSLYQHHECPVSIFSPEDSPVLLFPGLDCRHSGKRARFGENAQSRHLSYLRMLLELPENFFLINESDSFCLDPQIPQYLYDEPDTFWSNAIPDGGSRPGIPTPSFQPPWFMSRKTVSALIGAADKVAFDPDLPWDSSLIDFYLVQLSQAAGAKTSPFKNAMCVPIAASVYDDDPDDLTPVYPSMFGAEFSVEWQRGMYERGFEIAKRRAHEGANMVHSCKSLEAALALMAEYKGRSK
jgi:hypothetical protein